MHGTAFSGPQRHPGSARARRRWTRALENRLSRHGATRRGPHAPCGSARLRSRRGGTWRGFVYRTRPGLRHNHARGRRRRRGSHGRCNHARRDVWRRGRHGWRRRRRNGRRWWWRRRTNGGCWWSHRRRCGSRRSGGLLRWRRDCGFRRNCRGNRRRWSGPRGGWCSRCGFRRDGRTWNCRARGRGMRRCPFFLLQYGFEYVSRMGDVRQIDFGLDFFFASQRSVVLGRVCRRFGQAAEMGPHLFRFVLFERTGMRLFLGHSDERQHVENGLALEFQLSGEIVDSNLAHPAFLLPRVVLKSSSQPHGVSFPHSHIMHKPARAMTIRLFRELSRSPARALQSFSLRRIAPFVPLPRLRFPPPLPG